MSENGKAVKVSEKKKQENTIVDVCGDVNDDEKKRKQS